MNTKTIYQEEEFDIKPEKFFDLFLSSKSHSEFTDSEAKITKKIGAKFSTYNGYINGKNLKLERGKLIVQSWTAKDDSWPTGHESIVTMELSEDNGSTKVKFTHENVPVQAYEFISQGWLDDYWIPLEEYLDR